MTASAATPGTPNLSQFRINIGRGPSGCAATHSCEHLEQSQPFAFTQAI